MSDALLSHARICMVVQQGVVPVAYTEGRR